MRHYNSLRRSEVSNMPNRLVGQPNEYLGQARGSARETVHRRHRLRLPRPKPPIEEPLILRHALHYEVRHR